MRNSKESSKESRETSWYCYVGGYPVRTLLTALSILVVLQAAWMFVFMPLGHEIAAPAATETSACPTTDTLLDTQSYQTAPYKTENEAISAANDHLKNRADTQAGLAFNGYTCPNPNCQGKKRGFVKSTPEKDNPTASRLTLRAMRATLANFFSDIHWTGNMSYRWQVTVTCH